VRLEAVEQRLSGVVRREVRVRGVHDQATGGRGVKERTVGERLRRHVREPVVECREPASERRKDRHLLGGVAGHDLAVLVVGRLAAHLGRERADVVSHEPVHRGHGIGIRRRVVRRDHLLARHAAVAGRIDAAEQLRVDVRVLLARIGPRGVHVLGHAVGHDASVRAVLGPLRDRVAEVLADDPLEGLHLARLIRAAEQMIERAILEHDHHDVVKGVLALRCRHFAPPSHRCVDPTDRPGPHSNTAPRTAIAPFG
jgi:hypothetical protein